jgi:hypothetical protein
LSYRYAAINRPPVMGLIGVTLAAACGVGLALIGGDALAATEYQWGFAGYRDSPAQVVDTYVRRHVRSGNTFEVVLDAGGGGRRTIDVQHQPLFDQLSPGEKVEERLVGDRVVAIRAGNGVLPIDDNLAWLIGLPGGILLGLILLVMGIRAGVAKRAASEGPETLLLMPAVALGGSGILIGLVDQFTVATPGLPFVAAVVAVSLLGGVAFSIRMARMATVLAGRVNGTTAPRRRKARANELVTALIVSAKGSGWDVSFIGDGAVPKDLVVTNLDDRALKLIELQVADAMKRRPIDVSFAWYPWEPKGDRSRSDFRIFDARQESARYTATLDGSPEVTASSPTFEGLAAAIEAVMAAQPDAELPPLQACITWNRTLTAEGYEQAAAPS